MRGAHLLGELERLVLLGRPRRVAVQDPLHLKGKRRCVNSTRFRAMAMRQQDLARSLWRRRPVRRREGAAAAAAGRTWDTWRDTGALEAPPPEGSGGLSAHSRSA
jgi:hypothetical protein